FAILGEPTSAGVEGGCKGAMKLEVTARGVAAHAARDWVGDNAVHRLAPVLERLAAYEARRAVIDGLEYRECLNVVSIAGGIAGNVIPDRATALVNYRFAPDTTVAEAEAHVREVLAGLELEIEVVDASGGALPGLDSAAARGFLAALGEGVRVAAKQGWTDVARFSALGIPAVNFGPGDPLLAHTDDEHVPVQDLERALEGLRRFLTPCALRSIHDACGTRPPPQGSDHAARRAAPRPHHRPAPAGGGRPDGLAPHRPVAGDAHPVRVRRGVRGARRAGAGHLDLRLRPAGRGQRVLRLRDGDRR